MTAIKKVLANNVQSLSSEEQARARANIDASKVAIAMARANANIEFVSGKGLERDLATITPRYKSLFIISVWSSIVQDDVFTPADLIMEITAPYALKFGMSDDGALALSTCSYSVSSGTALRKQSSFHAVLAANETLTITGIFQSTVGGFRAEYAVSYTQVALE